VVQLTLFTLPSQEVIPLSPQPFVYPWGWFRGAWCWEISGGTSLVSDFPDKSPGYLERSPCKVGEDFQGKVVEKVSLMNLEAGWAWVVQLRDYSDSDIIAYQRELRKLRKSRCYEESGESGPRP